ncbi:hypothetical protein ARSEF4850_000773 [Beauveria asiatica]
MISSLAVCAFLFTQLVYAERHIDSPFDPFAASSRCPVHCNSELTQWSLLSSLGELSWCNSTLLFRCNLYNKAPDVPVQACVPLSAPIEAPSASGRSPSLRQFFFPFSKEKRASVNIDEKLKNVQLFRWVSDGRKMPLEGVAAAASALAEKLKVRPKDGGDSVLFAKRGRIIMGAFAGAELHKESVSEIVDRFAKWSGGQDGEETQTAAQICDEDSFTSQILGIFMDAQGDVASVQSKLRDWAQAKCLESTDALTETWRDVSVSVVSGQDIIEGTSDGNSSSYSSNKSENSNNSNKSNSSNSSNSKSSLGPAGTCKTTDAKPGDGCWSLAQRCGISVDDFKKHNADGICEHLTAGQHVCCSAGALPDFSPQPNPDGSCKTHTIQAGDVCDAIARRNDMTVDQIDARNRNVWGWTGCSYLIPGSRICLSQGEPPMPAPIPNAVCGPQVPGTERPAGMDKLAGLNPCPIRACCNVWGQCGITRDFCVSAPADTGAPGTSKPGANGCIYNCGMDIVNNDTPPKSFIRVGYFEAWNLNRPCLHMRASQIDTNRYTHIHFAFGNITNDYKADVSGAQDQFEKFKALKNVKRILSFGGWSFSTDADTAPIFRKGVTDAQRQAFATNVVSFIKHHGLDGVDFDWEYPGAPDIPGIPPGDVRDGERYLQFLKLVREQLPKDKLLGIAAPASYWYLKGFPISEIGEVVDYIIYMTYDMHGQWDYGNRWATPGCDEGNCLRSHVSTTETGSALVMITKAGVQANKVIIGMPLYGRSFKMAHEGCWGPDCHFVGPESRARPGRCTGTRGYISNFELREIMATADAEVHSSKDGDILVYDKTEWVAWMSPGMYRTRTDWVRGLNFGGTSDWAMDLDASHDDGDGPGGGDGGDGYLVVSPDLWKQDEPVISCYPPCTAVLPPLVLDKPTTISMKPETVTFEENWSTTMTVSGQLVTTSAVSITTTVVTVPPVTTTEINLWGVVWRNDKDDNVFNLTSSIVFPPVTLTKTRTDDDDRRPPITWTYSPRPQPTPDDDDDNGPKPPPPPPPPPHPPKVTMKAGPPKPKCKPGQKCGKPCRSNCDPRKTKCVGICGCIGPFCGNGDCVGPFCRPGNCVGLGCIGGGGGGGGGGGDGPEECRKRSYVSDCSVPCAVKKLPSTTTTTCRKETCSNTRYGCSITGTTTTSTTTASCGPPVSFQPYNPDHLVASVGDGGEGGIVLRTGNYTPRTKPTKTTTTTTTTTKPSPGPTNPSWPTLTPGIGRGPYCFRENNANNRYSEFNSRSAASVMLNLCTNRNLDSGNDFGYVSRHEASGLMGYVRWARDQSGCAAKKVVEMGPLCFDALRFIGQSCGDFDDPDHSYGGAFVEKRRYGCVEWYLGIDTAKKFMEAEGAVNTTDPNSKAVPTLTAVWGNGGTPLETGASRIDIFRKQD